MTYLAGRIVRKDDSYVETNVSGLTPKQLGTWVVAHLQSPNFARIVISEREPTEEEILAERITTALWGIDTADATEMGKALAPILMAIRDGELNSQ